MTADEAIELISEITSGVGFVYSPTVVTTKTTTATRGVQVAESPDKKITVKINADGICLEKLKTAIRSKVGDSVIFVNEIKPPTTSTKGEPDATA